MGIGQHNTEKWQGNMLKKYYLDKILHLSILVQKDKTTHSSGIH